jgi:hypothetical protein
MVDFTALYPYAINSKSAVTLPSMDDTPTTSKEAERLSGVKRTLKRVAVKFELSWQELSDFDSINRMAETSGEKGRRARRKERK